MHIPTEGWVGSHFAEAEYTSGWIILRKWIDCLLDIHLVEGGTKNPVFLVYISNILECIWRKLSQCIILKATKGVAKFRDMTLKTQWMHRTGWKEESS